MLRSRSVWCYLCVLCSAAPTLAAEVCLSENNGTTQLSLCGGPTFHTTTAAVSDARLIEVPDSTILLALWTESQQGGPATPYYGLAPDGQTVSTVEAMTYELRLQYARFDPAVAAPAVDGALAAPPDNRIYIAQFVTPPLSLFREQLRALGASIHHPLHANAYVVEMDDTVRVQVAALPYVRTVAPYQPAYRLEPYLVANLTNVDSPLPAQRYNIMVFERGLGQKTAVANQIVTLGGTIDRLTSGGFIMEATLTPNQLLAVAASNSVAFIDRWSEPSTDVDVARQVSGANYVESTGVPPFLGQGVIGEVMDDRYLDLSHAAFQTNLPVLHGPIRPGFTHGTNVFGTLFGYDPAGWPIEHPELPQGKGIVPAAQGIFADFGAMTDRHCHTCELVSSDCADVCGLEWSNAAAPYRAVFQTNSWGNNQTLTYDTLSSDLDDIIFTYDLLLCQSQSNCGNCPTCNCICSDARCSRPQAWSKNVVSVGGLYHLDDTQPGDDSWTGVGSPLCDPGPCGRASIGPAADGRIKPDLTNLYDKVLTTTPVSRGNYTPFFGGTSAATPITCGDFGVLFQMWHEGLFPVSPSGGGPAVGSGGQASVFDSRPHASTAKAVLINTAMQYDFVDPPGDPGPPHPDLTRDKQGWGMPSAGKLLALARRHAFLLVVNETDVLTEHSRLVYSVNVPTGAAALKITLVHTDPAGGTAPESAMANYLYLDAVGNIPVGPSYTGNLGLRSDIWSHPDDGSQPELWIPDTVQNIFVKDPVPGNWQISVGVGAIYVDARAETPDTDDVDYALVASIDFECDHDDRRRLDSEQIADGTSADCNLNGVLDACESSMGAAPIADPILNAAGAAVASVKNRFLSFSVTEPGLKAARVKFVSLPGAFSAFNDTTAWVASPFAASELPGSSFTDPIGTYPTFMAAQLSAVPVFADRSTFGVVHVFDERIIPSRKVGANPLEPALYEIQLVSDGCDVNSEASFSPPLTITNPRWGDLASLSGGQYRAPDGTVDVTADVNGVLAKFGGAATAPIKARAEMVGSGPTGPQAALTGKIEISDILAVLSAFSGGSYPYPPPSP